MTQVLKKDGKIEPFNNEKIAVAVGKAATRCDRELTKQNIENVLKTVNKKVQDKDEVSVIDLHEIVIASLAANGLHDIANSYAEYRYYKTAYAKTFEKLRQDADDVLRLGDRENANFDSALVSTKGSLIKGYLTKSLYKQFYLTGKEKELIERGDIYIHDLRDMILGCINCCLFDIGTVLKDGFEMSNVRYTEPKSVLSALQVVGDITLVATAQQFGGFTLAELDKVLLPYCKKTLDNATEGINKYFVGTDAEYEMDLDQYAWDVLKRELEQGFQSLELKLNTVPCSRGDFAFTTITFGQWDKNLPEDDRRILNLICETILNTRKKGHGGRPVVFPKLVFLYDANLINEDGYAAKTFQKAVETSAECMYPRH